MDRLLALNTSAVENGLEGERTTEPVFGLPAKWITVDQKEAADKGGYTVFDGPTIVATHLSELIKRYAGDIMGRKEVKNILDSVAKRNPVIIDELTKANIKTGDIQKILQDLLAEGISIRSIDTILEMICDHYQGVGSKEQLTERVRAGLKRQISAKHADKGKNIHVVVLSSELEGELAALASETESGYSLSLSPSALQKLVEDMGETLKKVREKGYHEVLITDPFCETRLKKFWQEVSPYSKCSLITKWQKAIHWMCLRPSRITKRGKRGIIKASEWPNTEDLSQAA